MFAFWMVVEAFRKLLRIAPKKKLKYGTIYGRGDLVGDQVLMDCGCRFNWADNRERPTICTSHRAIIAAEIATS